MMNNSVPTSPEEWPQYWQAKGFPWRTGPEIGVKRQEELNQRRAVVPDIKEGIYPFSGMKLSRADVEWLLATHENGQGPVDWINKDQREREGLDLRGADLRGVDLSGLPLQKADLSGAQLQEAHLIRAQLCEAKLAKAQLQGAFLQVAQLQKAYLVLAQLQKADLQSAQLQEAILTGAQLQEAILTGAQLRGVYLGQAQLQGAFLDHAQLQKADLQWAQLQGAFLREAQLQGADLRRSNLDGANLDKVKLSDETDGSVRLADITWGEVKLAVVKWEQVKMLGDECEALQRKKSDETMKDEDTRINEFQAAARANRQLAVALQDQGMSQDAAHFAYHAQTLQRQVFWLESGLPILGFKHQIKTLTLPQLWQQCKQLNIRRAGTRSGQWIRQQGQQGWHWLRALRPTAWLARLGQLPVWELALALVILVLALGASMAHWWGLLLLLLLIVLVPLGPRLLRGRKLLAYLFSGFLAVLTGYGFRMSRIIVAYLVLILIFSFAYWGVGVQHPGDISFWQALIVSVTAFHGRVFTNPFTPNVLDAQIAITAIEAVVGLIIEGVFIAMLVQRFFGK